MDNQPQPTKSTSKVLWIVLIIIVLAIAGYGIYTLVSNQGNENSNNANAAVNQNTNTTNTNQNMNVAVNSNLNTSVNQNVNFANTNSLANTNVAVDISQWKTYNDATYSFTLKYPSTWSYQKYTNGYNSLGSYVVAFTTNRTNISYLPTVSVRVGWSVADETNRINTSDPPYTKVTNSEEITVGSFSAMKLGYSTTEGAELQEIIIISGQNTLIFNSLLNDQDFLNVVNTLTLK